MRTTVVLQNDSINVVTSLPADVTNNQGCYRYFPKVSPIFDIDAGFKSIVDTDIDTLA